MIGRCRSVVCWYPLNCGSPPTCFHADSPKGVPNVPGQYNYSLVDIPVGLLAWILDKFFEWTETVDSPFETLSGTAFLRTIAGELLRAVRIGFAMPALGALAELLVDRGNDADLVEAFLPRSRGEVPDPAQSFG